MAKSCSTHVFGSVSGYTTLAKSSDISQEEDSALSGLGFGQTNNSNFIDGLFTTPTAYGRRLPSGRYAITRCFPGSPDVAGRITLLLASVIMDLDTWLNHIRGGLVKFLNDQSVWDLEKFSTGKQIKVGSFRGQLPTEASDYYLGDYLASIHNSSQNIVVVLPERSNTTDVICHLAGALAPEDAAEFRWGIRLLSTTSPVDVMTMVGAPSTAGRRKVIKCDVQHEFRNKGAEYYAQKCPSIPALPPITALASSTIVHERPTSKTIQFNYKPNKIILAIITIVFLLVAFFAISSSDKTGACCIGTNCIVKTEESCSSGGGTYKGDQSPCEDRTCQSKDLKDAGVHVDPVGEKKDADLENEHEDSDDEDSDDEDSDDEDSDEDDTDNGDSDEDPEDDDDSEDDSEGEAKSSEQHEGNPIQSHQSSDSFFKRIKTLRDDFVKENVFEKNHENNLDLLNKFKEVADKYIDYHINNENKKYVKISIVEQTNNKFFDEVIEKDIVKKLNLLDNELEKIIRGHQYKNFIRREDGGDRVADVHSIISRLKEVERKMYSEILEDYVHYLDYLQIKSEEIPKSSWPQEKFRSGKIMEKWRENLRKKGIQLERPGLDFFGNETTIPDIIASPNLDKRLKEIIKRLNETKIDWENEQGY